MLYVPDASICTHESTSFLRLGKIGNDPRADANDGGRARGLDGAQRKEHWKVDGKGQRQIGRGIDEQSGNHGDSSTDCIGQSAKDGRGNALDNHVHGDSK